MSEILFKSNEAMLNDNQSLQIEDLFAQPIISNSLLRLIPPAFMSLTPRQLYDQIKEIAKAKFNFNLPGE